MLTQALIEARSIPAAKMAGRDDVTQQMAANCAQMDALLGRLTLFA